MSYTHPLKDIQMLLKLQPFFRIPDLSKEFFFFTDSSSISISSYLAQQYDGYYLPTGYISRKLGPRRREGKFKNRRPLPYAFVWWRLTVIACAGISLFVLITNDFPYYNLLTCQRAKCSTDGPYCWPSITLEWCMCLWQIRHSNKLADFMSGQPDILSYEMYYKYFLRNRHCVTEYIVIIKLFCLRSSAQTITSILKLT